MCVCVCVCEGGGAYLPCIVALPLGREDCDHPADQTGTLQCKISQTLTHTYTI